jgi:hypothetical protein
MLTRKVNILVTVLFFLWFSSCEYNPHEENFRKIDLPQATHVFNLSLNPGGDTIGITSVTNMKFNLQTDGLGIVAVSIMLDDKTWSFSSSSGSFSIDPADFTAGFYILAMDVQTHSGSGSIADVVGAEGFLIKREWVLLIDGRGAPPLTVTSKINEDGYLQLYWSKNRRYNFSAYEIKGFHTYGDFTRMISDVNDTSLVDSCFLGGDCTYTVYSWVIGNTYSTKYHDPNIPVPFPMFEDIGLDSLRIYWNGLKGSSIFTLKQENVTIFNGTGTTSVTIPSSGFGVYSDYELITSPAGPCTSTYGFTLHEGRAHVLGQNIESNWPNYGYNDVEKVIYTNSYDQIHCYDVTSMHLLKTCNLSNLISYGRYSCPSNSSKVAVFNGKTITVFNDKNLQDSVRIPFSTTGKKADHFYMTDNGLIALALAKKYVQVSIAGKKIIAEIPITDYPVYSSWACISTSSDGRYAAVVTYNGISLFQIENGKDTLIYSDARAYRSVLFDVYDPGKLMLTFRFDNKLEIRNIPDFSLNKSIDLPTVAEVIRNIDPESGLLLLTDYVNLHVMDLNLPVEVLSVKSDDFKPYLFSNRLFSNTGYTLDISDYLPK